MSNKLESLLQELEAFGRANDSEARDHSQKMLNITRDTGELLEILALSHRARDILEIGTSNGYSTLWLAKAARENKGTVITVERSEYKAGLASDTFERSGLNPFIRMIRGEAGAFLDIQDDESFDFVFLDSNRSEYVSWWPRLRSVLRVGGLLVVDNAVSHKEQMRDFVTLVKEDSSFLTVTVPIGKGEFLALKTAQ